MSAEQSGLCFATRVHKRESGDYAKRANTYAKSPVHLEVLRVKTNIVSKAPIPGWHDERHSAMQRHNKKTLVIARRAVLAKMAPFFSALGES